MKTAQGGSGRRVLLFTVPAMLAVPGCNQPQVIEQIRYAGPPLRRPARIYVMDPGVRPSDVRLDQGVRESLMRTVSDEPVREQRLAAGRQAATAVAEETASRLRSYGLPAQRQTGLPPPSAEPVVIVEGHLLSVDQGNGTRRMVVGFGAGRSSVAVELQVFYREGNAQPRLIDSVVVMAESPRRPGGAAMVGGGAVAGRVLQAAAGSAVIGGISDARSADTGVEGRRIGDALAYRLGQLFAELGWVPRAAVQ